MGKKGGWFSAVKKAFSPSKDADKEAKSNRESSKTIPKERRRWVFGRSLQHSEASPEIPSEPRTKSGKLIPLPEKPFSYAEDDPNKHAMAVAAATAAAAEAAVAAAQAAAEVVRLTGAARGSFYGTWSREDRAAVKIQAAFRGYLARRALRALKGLVRLQALVRGHTVRRQTTVTLRCMQALVRVQARVRERRSKLLEDRQVVHQELWQKQKQHNDSSSRRSMSDTSQKDDWDDSAQSAIEAQAKLQLKQEAAAKRERALAYAISHQLWKSGGNTDPNLLQNELSNSHMDWSWLDRWMASRSWDGHALEKDVPEVSSTKSLEEIQPNMSNVRSSMNASTVSRLTKQQSMYGHSPVTPQTMNRPITNNVRSASPRSTRTLDEEVATTARSTPSLVSAPTRFGSRQSVASSSVRDDDSLISFSTVPSYMATTQSAKAKVRSQSTPKQRPVTPEESLSSAKKRLSFPQAESFIGASGPLKSSRPLGAQRSPSLKGHSGPLKFDRYLNEVTLDSSRKW